MNLWVNGETIDKSVCVVGSISKATINVSVNFSTQVPYILGENIWVHNTVVLRKSSKSVNNYSLINMEYLKN